MTASKCAKNPLQNGCLLLSFDQNAFWACVEHMLLKNKCPTTIDSVNSSGLKWDFYITSLFSRQTEQPTLTKCVSTTNI